MAGRKWTADESEYVKRNYRSSTAKQIGLAINRTEKAVHLHAYGLGLNEERDIESIAKCRLKIRELHSQGLSDSEIANEVGLKRRHIGTIRTQFGLPSNRGNRCCIAMLAPCAETESST